MWSLGCPTSPPISPPHPRHPPYSRALWVTLPLMPGLELVAGEQAAGRSRRQNSARAEPHSGRLGAESPPSALGQLRDLGAGAEDMAEPPTRSPALYRGAPGLTSAPRAHAGDTAVRPPLKARPCPTRESEGKPFPRRSPSWERRKERVPPWRHSRPQVAWDRGHRARPRRCPRVPAGGDGVGTGVRGDGAKRMEWGCVRGGGSAHVGMFPLWGRVGSPKAFGGVGERWDTAGSPRPQGDEKAGAGRARAELCGPSKSPVQQEGAVRADGGPWAGENPPWVRAAAAWGAGP